MAKEKNEDEDTRDVFEKALDSPLTDRYSGMAAGILAAKGYGRLKRAVGNIGRRQRIDESIRQGLYGGKKKPLTDAEWDKIRKTPNLAETLGWMPGSMVGSLAGTLAEGRRAGHLKVLGIDTRDKELLAKRRK